MSSETVCFPDAETGTTLLLGALTEAHRRFPAVFDGLVLPADGRALKRDLPDVLATFEARRAASPQRVDIAEGLAAYVAERVCWGAEALGPALERGAVGEPVVQAGAAAVGWSPKLTFRGETWVGSAIGDLATKLRADYQLTEAAAEALRWVAKHKIVGGKIDLRGEQFAVLGAGAELAPTSYLLRAGARVAWFDRAAPQLDPATFAGELVYYPGALDLLSDTPAIAAAVAREAARGRLHLGLFAYAPGKGRELLLTAAMNTIAARTEVASVSMLVSPTTPGEVQPEDRADRVARRSGAPRWQRVLARLRLLPSPAHHEHGGVEISRSIVPLQGPTYLAAQYLTKMMTAEVWSARRPGVRVSANVAGITHTKSLEHPLFLAGFAGARSFGIEIFDPEPTRVLTTLLMLHDVSNPDAPAAAAGLSDAERARRVAERAIHGGVRSAPFVFDHTIRVAAVLGLTKRPALLLKLRG
jgi:hypothetical protein